ncbi:Homeobox-like_domain superfamily [Hexamita inflata]|uniref:Homeobox-like domain superfamily n=1 Tax=Hexamita inflata TaxID=28002 RepID=A0AA86TPA3_9EUKA|nr:Homeobox-like domain superfamily [Hexamita inflata]
MLTSNMQKQENHKKYQKWTDDEKALFLQIQKRYTTAFDQYLPFFPEKTISQIKCFYLYQTNKIKEQTRNRIRIFFACSNLQKHRSLLAHKYILSYPDQSQIFQQPTNKLARVTEPQTVVNGPQGQIQECQKLNIINLPPLEPLTNPDEDRVNAAVNIEIGDTSSGFFFDDLMY